MTITSLPGVKVGHWTDRNAQTGCTVIRLPSPNRVIGEVRGGAPGTRETDLLSVFNLVSEANAVLFTGGSGFGLAATDGVMAALEEKGIGFPTPAGVVPIVPSAVIYDLAVGDPKVRPGPEQGRAALAAVSSAPVECGNVGAGTGATVSKWRGGSQPFRGGLGSTVVTGEGVMVGALVVVNALGDIYSLKGEQLSGMTEPTSPVSSKVLTVPFGNTTLMLVVTNAGISRSDLHWLVVRAHDALAACIRPGHTRYDGDIAMAVSLGEVGAIAGWGADDGLVTSGNRLETNVDVVAEMAFAAVGNAIESAVAHTASPA